MAERLKYVVVCDRGHEANAVALIDDSRPVGGMLTARGVGPNDTLRQFAVADGERHSDLYRKATAAWNDYAVTETEWGDGHCTWIFRCRDRNCGYQAQLRDTDLATIADYLATARDHLPVSVDEPTRREIPLSVLKR